MSEEQLIAEAILQLKQESNVIKDYIFPIAMALFSSLIGACIGYLIYLRQDKLVNEKRKLDVLNKWILVADEIHQSLLALKFNYHGSLTSHPYQRFLAIPSIIGTNKKYQFDYYELAFITDFKSNNKWLNVGYLRSLFSNYETLLSMWEIRNEFNEKVRIQFLTSKSENKAYVDLDDAEIEMYIDQGDLSFLIDITERCLRLTDDLITEFYNFFNEFPCAIANKVDLKLIKNYGFIIAFDMGKNKAIEPLLVDSPLPDYEKISELSGRSIEELMARYSSLFK
ncbi:MULTISPECIES: hypothetical protein [Acinetobacter]|uniref:hypothetical protein n=1 Tax=Acinetobacter TaxID=469 RepID=UPI00257FF460|nr:MULTISPECIES: hypothetical protein [Acinetobacter]